MMGETAMMVIGEAVMLAMEGGSNGGDGRGSNDGDGWGAALMVIGEGSTDGNWEGESSWRWNSGRDDSGQH